MGGNQAMKTKLKAVTKALEHETEKEKEMGALIKKEEAEMGHLETSNTKYKTVAKGLSHKVKTWHWVGKFKADAMKTKSSELALKQAGTKVDKTHSRVAEYKRIMSQSIDTYTKPLKELQEKHPVSKSGRTVEDQH